MTNDIIVTINDYGKLTDLIAVESLHARMPQVASQLIDKLTVAKKLAPKEVSKSVITMNSRVLLKELKSGRETEVTLSFPDDADSSKRRMSVLSPVGLQLLGRKEGHVIHWKIPGGVGQFSVMRVTYQPEAAGNYFE